jgi:peptide/nickel transport system permease protein
MSVIQRIGSFLLAKTLRFLLLATAVAILSFTLVSFSPIDPIRAYVGTDMLTISPEQRELISHRWGLDQPALTRFFQWFKQITSGNLGTSMIFDEPVSQVIAKRFSTSLALMSLAWTLSGLLGFILGSLAGIYKDSLLDRIIRWYAYTLASTPTFWIGLILLIIFSVTMDLFPICCAQPPGMSPDDVTIWNRLHHLLLPAVTLSVIGVANITLHTREKMIDSMQSDYALYARAMGDSTFGIGIFHGIRNAALPAVTLQFASLGELFGGSVLAEQVFSYPGLGQATVMAGTRGDVPLLMGIVLFSCFFVYCGNSLADLIYLSIDPRMGKESG